MVGRGEGKGEESKGVDGILVIVYERIYTTVLHNEINIFL